MLVCARAFTIWLNVTTASPFSASMCCVQFTHIFITTLIGFILQILTITIIATTTTPLLPPNNRIGLSENLLQKFASFDTRSQEIWLADPSVCNWYWVNYSRVLLLSKPDQTGFFCGPNCKYSKLICQLHAELVICRKNRDSFMS